MFQISKAFSSCYDFIEENRKKGLNYKISRIQFIFFLRSYFSSLHSWNFIESYYYYFLFNEEI